MEFLKDEGIELELLDIWGGVKEGKLETKGIKASYSTHTILTYLHNKTCNSLYIGEDLEIIKNDLSEYNRFVEYLLNH